MELTERLKGYLIAVLGADVYPLSFVESMFVIICGATGVVVFSVFCDECLFAIAAF